MSLLRPRALRSGDRVALLAPASAFPREDFDRGLTELRGLGLEPVFDESIFDQLFYEAGTPERRAAAFVRALEDPSVSALLCVRGGYGSVKLLERLDPALVRRAAKPFIGYSDLTSVLTFYTQACGMVAFHGAMLATNLSRGDAGFDRASLLAALTRPEPLGEVRADALEVIRPGEVAGPLYGGTMTVLAASLGTPYAFDPPPGHVLFVEDIQERPYKIDRLLVQLRLSGVLARARAVVFGEMLGCDDPDGSTTARATVARLMAGFPGPVLYGLPSGHTSGPTLTLPFGVEARVIASGAPRLVVEGAAVE